MYDIVYLTEKDSQVQILAKILGCKYTKKWYPAYSENNKIAIVPLQGHVFKLLDYPQDYDPAYKKWTESTLLCFPNEFKIEPYPNKLDLLNRAVEHLKQAKQIRIATDFDNEGAALARRVLEYANVMDKVSDMIHMGALDEESLIKAINNPEDIPWKRMALAGYARAYIDWAEGMSYSRAFSYYLGGNNSGVYFGGVKTPIVYLVTQRDLAFENHVKTPYFTVNGVLQIKNNNINFSVKHKENGSNIEHKEDADKIVNFIKNNFNQLKISNIKSRKTISKPIQLYDLMELQADMSKLYNIEPNQTLSIAQDLYDKYQIQTYPRTEVRYLADTEYKDVPIILQNIKEIELFSNEIDEILSTKIPKYTSVFNSKEVTSHGALVLTKKQLKGVFEKLNDIEQKMVQLVAKRYIANFMPLYQANIIEITIDLFDEYYIFFKEEIPTEIGWKKLYYPNMSMKDYNSILSQITKEDLIEKIIEIKRNDLFTKPKPPYTYENLLKDLKNVARMYPNNPIVQEHLKERGIGTPATIGSILEQLFKPAKNGEESLLFKDRKYIKSSKRAREQMEKIPEFLIAPIKRAELMKDIHAVEKGEILLSDLLNTYKEKIRETIFYLKEYAKDNSHLINTNTNQQKEEKEVLGKCPICNGNIIEKEKFYACINAKWEKDGNNWVNNGCSFQIWKNALQKFNGSKIGKRVVKKLLKGEEVEVTLVSKSGNKYVKNIEIDPKWGIKIKF